MAAYSIILDGVEYVYGVGRDNLHLYLRELEEKWPDLEYDPEPDENNQIWATTNPCIPPGADDIASDIYNSVAVGNQLGKSNTHLEALLYYSFSKGVAQQLQDSLYFPWEGPEEVPECNHEYVNVGFMSISMICKHCDRKQEDGK